MAEIRSKDGDVVIRYAGRRMRITPEWCDITEDAIEKVLSEAEHQIEFRDPQVGARYIADSAEAGSEIPPTPEASTDEATGEGEGDSGTEAGETPDKAPESAPRGSKKGRANKSRA